MLCTCRPPRDLDSKACVTIGDQVNFHVSDACSVFCWAGSVHHCYFCFCAELCGEGGWLGADWRAGERSIRSCGQDETRTHQRYHGRQGQFTTLLLPTLYFSPFRPQICPVWSVSIKRWMTVMFMCLEDSCHREYFGAEEAAHGPGHFHEDGGLPLHCDLLWRPI